MIERVWIMLSGMLLVIAAFFVWRNNLPAAFVSAALGACAWFLSYRGEMKRKIADDEDDSDSDGAENDHDI